MNCCVSDNRNIKAHRRLENEFLITGCSRVSRDSWSGQFCSPDVSSDISLSSTSIFRSLNHVTLICFQNDLNFRSAHWADSTKLIIRNIQWSETLKLQCDIIIWLSNYSCYALSSLAKNLPCKVIWMNITTYRNSYSMNNIRQQDKVHYFSHFRSDYRGFLAGVKKSHSDQSSDQTVEQTWNMMTQFLFKFIWKLLSIQKGSHPEVLPWIP